MNCSFVENIPYIGRIGPVYSRYVKWRASESGELFMVRRSDARKRHFRPMVEKAAEDAINGRKVDVKALKERLPKGEYEKVWLVGPDGRRRAAGQLIKKEKQNGI